MSQGEETEEQGDAAEAYVQDVEEEEEEEEEGEEEEEEEWSGVEEGGGGGRKRIGGSDGRVKSSQKIKGGLGTGIAADWRKGKWGCNLHPNHWKVGVWVCG